MDIIKKYNDYKNDEMNVWLHRFTWGGLDGLSPKVTTNIFRFFNETNVLHNVEHCNTTDELWTSVSNLANDYVKWVCTKTNGYSQKEQDNMRDFFVGAIGEYFFVHLFEFAKSLDIPVDDVYTRFDFNYVSPTLPNEDDYGIDVTGIVNDVPCVLQVKFWNPYGTKNVDMEIFQKAFADGVMNDIISKDHKHNVILCWLGVEEKGLANILRNKPYKDKVLAIGLKTLSVAVNNRYQIFWDKFYEKLANLKEN